MSFNIKPHSNSSFNNDVINQIIFAINQLDDVGMTDSAFLNKAHTVLFAGTFLPDTSNTSLSFQPLNPDITNWNVGGGNNTTSPMISFNVNTLNCQNANVNTLSTTNFSTQNLNYTGTATVNFPSLSVNNSTVITQDTLPVTITSVGNVTLSGSTTGNVLIVQIGTTFNFYFSITVASSITTYTNLIAPTITNANFNQLCNRLRAGGLQTTASTLIYPVTGVNGSTVVYCYIDITQQFGMEIYPLASNLNVGDTFSGTITVVVDNFN